MSELKVAENNDGNCEYADDQSDDVTIHDLGALCRGRQKGPGQLRPAGANCRTLASMGGIEGARRTNYAWVRFRV